MTVTVKWKETRKSVALLKNDEENEVENGIEIGKFTKAICQWFLLSEYHLSALLVLRNDTKSYETMRIESFLFNNVNF